MFIGYIPRAENGYTWLPADEEQEVTGYQNKPPTWTSIIDDGAKPENNATLNPIYVQTGEPAHVNGAIWQNPTTKLTQKSNGSTWELLANAFDNTSDITDGAGLGTTATWSGVTGTGTPEDNATWNGIYTQASAPTNTNGAIWQNVTTGELFRGNGSTWDKLATQNDVYVQASAPTNTNGAIWQNSVSKVLYRGNGSTWDTLATENTGALADLDTVDTAQIVTSAVTTEKIANNAVTAQAKSSVAGFFDVTYSAAPSITRYDSGASITIGAEFAGYTVDIRIRAELIYLSGVFTYTNGSAPTSADSIYTSLFIKQDSIYNSEFLIEQFAGPTVTPWKIDTTNKKIYQAAAMAYEYSDTFTVGGSGNTFELAGSMYNTSGFYTWSVTPVLRFTNAEIISVLYKK